MRNLKIIIGRRIKENKTTWFSNQSSQCFLCWWIHCLPGCFAGGVVVINFTASCDGGSLQDNTSIWAVPLWSVTEPRLSTHCSDHEKDISHSHASKSFFASCFSHLTPVRPSGGSNWFSLVKDYIHNPLLKSIQIITVFSFHSLHNLDNWYITV